MNVINLKDFDQFSQEKMKKHKLVSNITLLFVMCIVLSRVKSRKVMSIKIKTKCIWSWKGRVPFGLGKKTEC